MPGAPYHAEAFPLPGRCFRLVAHYGEPAEPLPGAGDLAGLVAGPQQPPLPVRGRRRPSVAPAEAGS